LTYIRRSVEGHQVHRLSAARQLSTVSLRGRPHLSDLKCRNTIIIASCRTQPPLLKWNRAIDPLESGGRPSFNRIEYLKKGEHLCSERRL
jgi:hypothetical protein